MNRKTQQILIAAVVLAAVTVLSFGLRQVRVSMHQARTAKELVSKDAGSEEYSANEPVASARNTQPQERFDAPLEEELQPTDLEADEAMTDSEDAFAEEKDQDGPDKYEDVYEAKKRWDKSATFAAKKYSAKFGAKGKGKGKSSYIPTKLSDTETLYTGKNGDYWYVQKLPNGEVTKTQMQEIDGELQPVGETNTYPADGGKGESGGGKGK